MVQHFSARHGQVAVILEVALQRRRFGEGGQLLVGRAEFVAAVGGGGEAGHDADPRRRAHRHGAVGIGEIAAPLGEAVHVRRERLGMAAEKTGPVVEIVDGDEQDVGALFSRQPGRRPPQRPITERRAGGGAPRKRWGKPISWAVGRLGMSLRVCTASDSRAQAPRFSSARAFRIGSAGCGRTRRWATTGRTCVRLIAVAGAPSEIPMPETPRDRRRFRRAARPFPSSTLRARGLRPPWPSCSTTGRRRGHRRGRRRD